MSTSATWVSWVIQCQVSSDKKADLLTLAEEMSKNFSANEPGTLNFEWSVDASFSELHLHERYADSTTALGHIQTFGSSYAERFLALASIQSVTVYGFPSEELLSALSAMSPKILQSVSGFTR